MDKEDIKCKHIYREVKRKVIVPYRVYEGSYKNTTERIEQEEIYLFCERCGDNKLISEKIKTDITETKF